MGECAAVIPEAAYASVFVMTERAADSFQGGRSLREWPRKHCLQARTAPLHGHSTPVSTARTNGKPVSESRTAKVQGGQVLFKTLPEGGWHDGISEPWSNCGTKLTLKAGSSHCGNSELRTPCTRRCASRGSANLPLSRRVSTMIPSNLHSSTLQSHWVASLVSMQGSTIVAPRHARVRSCSADCMLRHGASAAARAAAAFDRLWPARLQQMYTHPVSGVSSPK